MNNPLFGIDCASPLTATKAKALAAAGAKFVLRYHTIDAYKWKRLTAAEAKAIQDAGLMLGAVFQRGTSDVLGAAVNGMRDGKQALIEARNAGQPAGSVIFFAVDFNAQAKDMSAIEAYLRAVTKELAGYKVGVYGHHGVIEEMARRNACAYFWQTYAWSGGKKSQQAHLYQYKNDTTLAGHLVDFNEAFSDEIFWGRRSKEDLKKMKTEDAEKVVKILQAAWQLDMRNAIDTVIDRQEINRLANEVRKAGGIAIPSK